MPEHHGDDYSAPPQRLHANYREPSAASIRLSDRRNKQIMNSVLLVLAAVLTQVAFVTLVRKVHDRSIQQALVRWFGR
jgi:hypothetical protein